MVLGEEILLYRSEDAENLVRFAKKHNCSASKRVITSIHTEMNLRGTLRSFLEYAREGQNGTESNAAPEMKDLFQEASEEIHHRREIFKEFLARNTPGDRIDQGAEWERLQELTLPDPSQPVSLSAEDEAFLRDRYLILVLLQENGLVETRDGGMYLKGSIDPDEAITQYPADLLMEPERSDLAAHGLTRLITTYSQTTYPVTLGPESVLMIELEELEEFCKTCEVDEDSLARALMNLALKKMIVDKVILFLREQKKTTRDEMQAHMRDFDLAVPDTVDHFAFHLHTIFIDEVLDDLRKMRTIQGKDTKIRYTGA
jgi:hypothetical protein